MTLPDRINAYAKLGQKIKNLNSTDLVELYQKSRQENPWFDQPNVERALNGLASMLDDDKLEKWTAPYPAPPELPKIIGIIMAGNIPMVGFHDLMCVLVSGHVAAVKMSSQDSFLMNQVISWLLEIEPRFKQRIEIKAKMDGIDAVICTGSDNTARYFEYYFGKYPHIIRKNRTSVAILDGSESTEELSLLGQDVFSYYGLGCRNVSKLMVPNNYDFTRLFESWEQYSDVTHHHKYNNNYDYNRAIYLVNMETHLDNGFVLLRPSSEIVSPMAVLYHEAYSDSQHLQSLLDQNQNKIQCVVGKGRIPFGQAQSPELWDYADGVDTLKFLMNLK